MYTPHSSKIPAIPEPPRDVAMTCPIALPAVSPRRGDRTSERADQDTPRSQRPDGASRVCIRRPPIPRAALRAPVFSENLDGRCVIGARGGLSLAASG